jgi:probable rRNA maturation factor
MAAPARLQVEVFKAGRMGPAPSFVARVLQRAAELAEVGARMPAGPATVAVRLTGDEELRRLNHDYAGHDAVTDVLSFEGSGPHLGDVAISWPAVVRQGLEYGHGEEVELGLLSVHGLLHLLGWDHQTATPREEMNRLTLAALDRSGLRPAPTRL